MPLQVSELYRRGVVRPLDQRAKLQLSQNFVSSSIRCEWLPILGDQAFQSIWATGVLQAVGRECGYQFSDYEELLVDAIDVKNVHNSIQTYRRSAGVEGDFFEALALLLADAVQAKVPVLFVF